MKQQEVFKALADPTRRAILKRLQGGAMNAGEIGEAFDITPASLSHHFAVLKHADLVRTERQGQFIGARAHLDPRRRRAGFVPSFAHARHSSTMRATCQADFAISLSNHGQYHKKARRQRWIGWPSLSIRRMRRAINVTPRAQPMRS